MCNRLRNRHLCALIVSTLLIMTIPVLVMAQCLAILFQSRIAVAINTILQGLWVQICSQSSGPKEARLLTIAAL